MKILLTGGAGTVGIEILRQLCTSPKHSITVFERPSKKVKRILRPYREKVQIVYGDISKKEDVIPVCKGLDTVIHLAAVIPPLADKDPDLAFQVNVKGTENLLLGLQYHQSKAFFVYASSVSVYGDRLENPNIKTSDPLVPSVGDEYAKTKIEAESLIQNSTLDWTILRLSAIMGTGNHKLSGLLFHMPLSTPLEITTPQDAGRAFVEAIDHQSSMIHKIYNLGGGKECRAIYQQFLASSFSISGLGALDFPDKAFAQKNFHCGYYADGEELENLLHFRRDNLDTYYKRLSLSVSPIQRAITMLFRRAIKRRILTLSEPYHAFKTKDPVGIQRFFRYI